MAGTYFSVLWLSCAKERVKGFDFMNIDRKRGKKESMRVFWFKKSFLREGLIINGSKGQALFIYLDIDCTY